MDPFCPVQDFTLALNHLMTRMRSGTLLRAGGQEALHQHYATHFGTMKCTDASVQLWPRSERPATPKLIIDAADGSTGTRFLACIGQALGLRVAHNKRPPTIPFTSYYDNFDMLLDSPVPYQTHPLLATHASNQTVLLLTVRDPWDWLQSRLKNHAPFAKNWSAAGGGCALAGTKLGSSDALTFVPRDLLTYWAWALCRMAKRERGGLSAVPIIHLFEDDQCSSLRTMMHVFVKAGHRCPLAFLEDVWNGTKPRGQRNAPRCNQGGMIPARGCAGVWGTKAAL